jgi:hypothetical protein
MVVLAQRDGMSLTIVEKLRERTPLADEKVGPPEPRSTKLRRQREVMVAPLAHHWLLPLNHRLHALRPSLLRARVRPPSQLDQAPQVVGASR